MGGAPGETLTTSSEAISIFIVPAVRSDIRLGHEWLAVMSVSWLATSFSFKDILTANLDRWLLDLFHFINLMIVIND